MLYQKAKELLDMNPETKRLLLSPLIWAVIALTVGVTIGELHGRKVARYSYAQSVVYRTIPECVEEYDVLARGETNTVKRNCGQRLWSFVNSYDMEFAGGTPPEWFPKWMPEARRIIGIISNEDRTGLMVTNAQEAALLRQMYGTNTLPLDTRK